MRRRNDSLDPRAVQHALSFYRRAIDQLDAKRQKKLAYDARIDRFQVQGFTGVRDSERDAVGESHSQMFFAIEQFSRDWHDAVAPWQPSIADQWAASTQKVKASWNASNASGETPLHILGEYEHNHQRQTEGLLQWLSTHSDKIPRESSFWCFVRRQWNRQSEGLSNLVASAGSSTPTVIKSNIDRLDRERYGATEEEREKIDRQLSWWLAAYSHVHPHSLATTTSTMTLQSDSTLDLADSNFATTNVELQSATKEPLETKLVAVYDARALDVFINGNSLTPGASITIPKDADLRRGIKLPVAVRNRNGRPVKQPIVLVATRGADQRRLVVAVESPNAPLVSVQISNSNTIRSRVADSASGNNTRLFANQVNGLAISLTNLTESSATYRCRILHVARIDAIPPAGSLSNDEGKRWLEHAGGALVLAASLPIMVGAGESKAPLFAPAPWPPENPCPIVSRLVLEVQDEKSEKVQFVDWVPQVVPPSRYLASQVEYDANLQAIDVLLRLHEDHSISDQGTEVMLDILDGLTYEKVASSTVRLGNGLRKTQASLSCGRCRSGRAIMNVTVDGWTSTFVYEIYLDQSGSYEPSRQLKAMRLVSSESDSVVPTKQSNVSVQFEAILSDDGFDESRDSITVGLDRNGNRSLSDDVSLTLRHARCIRFEWQGVGADGLPALHSVIENHRLSLPIEATWNQWLSALAELQQGDKVFHSAPIPFVLDRVPPKFESIRILGKQPSLLASPVQVEIEIDDEGLSGCAGVDGAWSTTGELELKTSDKAIPAVYRDADRWLLTIPTEGMPSGKSILLLRASDRAGNVGKTYPVTVDLRTQDEIIALEASIKTQIRGQAKYGSKPLQGMTLKLIAVPEETKASQEAKPPVAAAIATALSQADGRFVLDGVPSGRYTLEISGIVRGMREKRTQDVVVDARGLPLEILLQMDKKP